MLEPKTIKKYFGERHVEEVETLLAESPETDLDNMKLKNPVIAQILSILTGYLGIDRLYQGGLKMLGCKLAMVLLTFGTWWIADFYYSRHTTEENNYNQLVASVS